MINRRETHLFVEWESWGSIYEFEMDQDCYNKVHKVCPFIGRDNPSGHMADPKDLSDMAAIFSRNCTVFLLEENKMFNVFREMEVFCTGVATALSIPMGVPNTSYAREPPQVIQAERLGDFSLILEYFKEMKANF